MKLTTYIFHSKELVAPIVANRTSVHEHTLQWGGNGRIRILCGSRTDCGSRSILERASSVLVQEGAVLGPENKSRLLNVGTRERTWLLRFPKKEDMVHTLHLQ